MPLEVGVVYYRPQWEKYRRKDGSVSYRAKRWWPEWEPLERVLDGELLGSLHEERVRCGKPTCRCASGQREDAHTAFYRRWLDEDTDKQRKVYVKRKDVEAVRAAIQRRRARLAQEREEREEEMGRGKYSWKAQNAKPRPAPPASLEEASISELLELLLASDREGKGPRPPAWCPTQATPL